MTPESIQSAMSESGPGPLRAIDSLREHHVASLARAFSPWLATWSLDRHEGYDGDLTLILSSACGAVSLVFSRSAAGFHAAIMEADAYRALGCFPSLDKLVAATCEFLPPP
jgi:hypothetical protein